MPEQNEAVVAQGDEQQLQQQVNSEEQASAEAQKGGESASEQESQQSTDDEQQHKRLGGWQRKIQKLERQNEALLQELLRRNSQTTEPKTKEQKEPDELREPEPMDFDLGNGTYDAVAYLKAARAYDRAQVDRMVAQRLEEREQKVTQKTAEQKRIEAYVERVREFSKAHPDFDEVLRESEFNTSNRVIEEVLSSELGPAIAYHLATNPEEAARISRLPEGAQIREIGKLEARLEIQKPEAGEEADEQAPLPPKQKAPPPISPVPKSGGPTDDGRLRDDLSPEEWDRRFRKRMGWAK